VSTHDLVGADRIQDLLGVDRSTVYRMASDGRLPAVKVGRQWRFPLDEVTARLQLDPPPADERSRPEGTAAGIDGNGPRDRSGRSFDPAAVEPLLEVAAEGLGVMLLVSDMRGCRLTHVLNPCTWFVERAADPEASNACVAEWQDLADDVDLTPRFRRSKFGFECARAFIRSETELVGMVVAGGVAPLEGPDRPDLHHLDVAGRERVLAALPRLASGLSRLAGHPAEPELRSALTGCCP